MNTISLTSSAILLASGLLAAGAAEAQKARIEVGDLSTPAGAHAFDRRLSDGARRFCAARHQPMELDAISACEKGVRDEALAELSPAQRKAYVEGLRPPQTLAAAGR